MSKLHWKPVGKPAPCGAPLTEPHALVRSFYADYLLAEQELCEVCKAAFVAEYNLQSKPEFMNMTRT